MKEKDKGMKVKSVEEKDNEYGHYTIQHLQSGLITIIHTNSTQKYIDNFVKPMNLKSAAKEKEFAEGMKIQAKMREMAIIELEKEK